MSERADKAVEKFLNGLNCSQAVFSAFSESYGLDRDTAIRIACGLGGGARLGEICGAASGAVLVIGLKYGNECYENLESKAHCYEKTREFLEEFQKRNGSVVCKELLDCNISTCEGMDYAKEKKLFITTCPRLVASAVELLEQLGY
ncbi:MAG TPA: C-GCAxxG-C-C family protein [Lachnospiraceae bacterium]|nr:C-GCAxxG-C-C family protein [Lachnospiraceae bacterium]